jgi:hypothetical protein
MRIGQAGYNSRLQWNSIEMGPVLIQLSWIKLRECKWVSYERDPTEQYALR